MVAQHRAKRAQAWRRSIPISAACLALVALWALSATAPGSATFPPADGARVQNIGSGKQQAENKPEQPPVDVQRRVRKDLPPGPSSIGQARRQQAAEETTPALDLARSNAAAMAFISVFGADSMETADINTTVAVNGIMSRAGNDKGSSGSESLLTPTSHENEGLTHEGAASSKAAPVIKSTSALFLSFHEGTAVDFNYVARKLGIERVEWKYPRNKNVRGLGRGMYHMPYTTATALWRAYEREACQSYDWIVVGDTIPSGGRAFIEGLLGLDSGLAPGSRASTAARRACKAKIILLATTRFDYGHFEDLAYRTSFQLAVSRGLVTVIANNPFEEWYMRFKGVQVPGGVPVIRPHGQGWKEWQTVEEESSEESIMPVKVRVDLAPRYWLPAVVAKRETEQPLVQLLEEGGVEFNLVEDHYGGPFALAEYQCVIHSPYQVSTMSLYENLAAGVVIFVPDVPLLEVLKTYTELCLPDDMLPDGVPWDLVDWYSPYFDPVIIKFSSTYHLQELLETTDFEAQRQRILDFMAEHEHRTLEQWRQILFDGKDGGLE